MIPELVVKCALYAVVFGYGFITALGLNDWHK